MRKCRDFDHPKLEEVKIRRLFVPTMDNSDRKRNNSAIDNNDIFYLRDDSHIQLFHVSSHDLVPLWPDKWGSTVFCNSIFVKLKFIPGEKFPLHSEDNNY